MINEGVYKGIGIESDPREIQFARSKGLEVIEGFFDPDYEVQAIQEIVSKADVVSMFNVLEHIEYPHKTIEILEKNMKTGSLLVLEVPRHPSMASFANLIYPQFTYRHITPPVHLQIFSEKSIEILTSDSFNLLATWGFGQGYTDILTNAVLLDRTKDTTLYQQLMDISNDVQKIIDENGYSDTMIFVLKRL